MTSTTTSAGSPFESRKVSTADERALGDGHGRVAVDSHAVLADLVGRGGPDVRDAVAVGPPQAGHAGQRGGARGEPVQRREA